MKFAASVPAAGILDLLRRILGGEGRIRAGTPFRELTGFLQHRAYFPGYEFVMP